MFCFVDLLLSFSIVQMNFSLNSTSLFFSHRFPLIQIDIQLNQMEFYLPSHFNNSIYFVGKHHVKFYFSMWMNLLQLKRFQRELFYRFIVSYISYYDFYVHYHKKELLYSAHMNRYYNFYFLLV